MSKKSTTAKSATRKSPRKSQGAARVEGAAKTERLRKTALAEIGERLADDGKPTPKVKPSKAPKPPKDRKARRTSALDAAATVLAKAARPMNAAEMIAAMAGAGLWKSPGGRTPEATLYAAIIREIARKGTQARFRKTDRGMFAATGKGA